MKNATLIHNHPSGSAFSKEDIMLAIYHDLDGIHAIGQKVKTNYYLTRPSKGWPEIQYVRNVFDRISTEVRYSFMDKISNGSLTIEAAESTHAEAVMIMLVDEVKEFKGCFIKKQGN